MTRRQLQRRCRRSDALHLFDVVPVAMFEPVPVVQQRRGHLRVAHLTADVGDVGARGDQDQIPYRAFRETLSLLGYQDVRAGRGEASEARVPR